MTDDLISRQAVLEWCGDVNMDVYTNEVKEFVIQLPPVNPQEPKTGHWISRPHIYGVAFCSECGFELKINNTNYCPNCGCRMVKPQESEDKE